MTPSQASAELRRIAAGIDNSKKPDPRLVAADIRKLIANLGGAPVENVGQQEEQQDQTALARSDVGKKMLAEALGAAQKALEANDPHGLDKAIDNVVRAHKPAKH